MTSGDDNTRAAWVCAIWAGVATRLIRERKAKEPPMTERAVAQSERTSKLRCQGHPLPQGARSRGARRARPSRTSRRREVPGVRRVGSS